ncbi:MAG: aldose 1-epimerase family protein [Bacteroidia bacterium]
MESVITNGQLTAIIKHHGAELCSLKNKDGVEFIWQADKVIWGRHAPVLFPIVGKLKNDSYTYNDDKYSLSQHGFARDKKFELTDITSNKVSFSLKADDETISKYPFRFELLIIYALKENSINVLYEVLNNDRGEMPFSIGAHPGFCCPISKDEKFEDYEIRFSDNEKLETALLKEGLFNGEKKLLAANDNVIKLNADTFINDALVFENLKSTHVILHSTKSKHFVELSFKGFPYLGIWSKPGAHFVCLEPWCGKADSVTHDDNIMNKEGIIILKPGKHFSCSYNIKVS